MLLCKIKTAHFPMVIISALLFLTLTAAKLYPFRSMQLQLERKNVQSATDKGVPAPVNSDSTKNRNRYKWYIRKQLIPVNYHWLSMGINGGILNNSSVSRLTGITITSGRYTNTSNFIQLSGTLGWMYLKKSSEFHREIESNIKMYNISLEFKSFLPSYIPEVTQYFLFGIGMDCFSFRYKNPVVLEYYQDPSEGRVIEEVQDDYFTALNIHVGLGFFLAEVNDYKVCAEISPGYIFPATATYLEMENPLLKKAFFIKLNLSIYFTCGEI